MYCDSARRIKYPTLPHHAVKEAKLREAFSEEMRVLYVAMTRARERLVMIGSAESLEKQASRWYRSASESGWGLPEEVCTQLKASLIGLVLLSFATGTGFTSLSLRILVKFLSIPKFFMIPPRIQCERVFCRGGVLGV